jgi:DNA-binding LytR/AlgR family response regulator
VRRWAQAVAAIQHHTPDLVFLDVQMPGVDGFGVINAIGADRMPTVIFVTAYDEYALRAFEVHALDYLLKPFGRERFRETLKHARASLERGARAILAAGCSRSSTTSSPKRRSSIVSSSSPAAASSSCVPKISTGSRRPATTCVFISARRRICSARR